MRLEYDMRARERHMQETQSRQMRCRQSRQISMKLTHVMTYFSSVCVCCFSFALCLFHFESHSRSLSVSYLHLNVSIYFVLKWTRSDYVLSTFYFLGSLASKCHTLKNACFVVLHESSNLSLNVCYIFFFWLHTNVDDLNCVKHRCQKMRQ